MKNKFGVCNYDFNAYEPKVENLEIFDEYEDARSLYLELLNNVFEHSYLIPDNLWIVFIEPDNNRIVQFDRLSTLTKCQLVDLEETNE